MDLFDHGHSRLIPGLLDLVIMGFYLMVIFLVAHTIQNRNIDSNPAYKYYKLGLFAKIFAAICFCMVYTLYYKEGADTTMYFRNSQSLVKLLFQDPVSYIRLLFGHRSDEVYYMFTNHTGWPWMYRDPESFVVVRLTSPFTLLGLGNFYTTTILVAWVSYMGIWKLYLLFCKIYPGMEKYFAWAVLFYPSVVFWGSGILKDTYSVMALGIFIYSFYHAMILKKNIGRHMLWIILSLYIIMIIKPYIVVALMPGVFIWVSFNKLRKLENPVIRWALAPAVLAIFLFVALGIIGIFSSELGEYGNAETMIRKAQITQDDLKRAEAYSENYFDIGDIDGTLSGFVRMAPAAIVAGIFRPFLWDVRNVLMLLSGLENAFIIFITLLILWRTGPFRAMKIIANEPLVIFSLLFVIIFAFAIGVTTANFGALVRLRIPLLPFYAGALVILHQLSLQWNKKEKEKNP
jgi:hypothetical protein